MKKLIEIGVFIGVGLWLMDKIGLSSVASGLKIRIGGFDIANGGIVIKLMVDNPQNAGFVIYSIVGSVYIDQSMIGDVSMFTPITIAPLTSTPIPITIRPSLLGSLSLLSEVINGDINLSVPIGFRANINADNTLIPIDISYRYTTNTA